AGSTSVTTPADSGRWRRSPSGITGLAPRNCSRHGSAGGGCRPPRGRKRASRARATRRVPGRPARTPAGGAPDPAPPPREPAAEPDCSLKEGYPMPEAVSQPGDIRPGDLFEDCRYHPCLCYDVSDDGEAIFGISLVDGSTWQCSLAHCGVRKLTP